MTAIIEKLTKSKLDVPNSRIFTECKKRFRSLLPFEAHALVLDQISARQYSVDSAFLVRDAPLSLKHAALTLRASNQEIQSIRQQLKKVPKQSTKESHMSTYFPFLRGKQNELFALREVSADIAASADIYPIIEPVNDNGSTRNSFENMSRLECHLSL